MSRPSKPVSKPVPEHVSKHVSKHVSTIPAGSERAPRRDGEPDAAPETPGAILNGRYQYLGLISTGGMASVHCVRDLELLRLSAMKILAPALAAQPGGVERFLREAQVTAQLDHPNIVPVYELGTDPAGNRYFTMKKVDGQTLTEWISQAGEPPPGPEALHEMLLAFLKVCDAVAFAHSRGVLHCDLKPDNVMVGPFGQVYVMDWGLAIVDAADAPPGGQVRSGTPSFMSPEHVSGLPLTEQTDVFGLGAILYSILTGDTPYDADDGIKAMAEARACAIRIPAFDSGRPLLGDLGRIVEKAMAREPDHRYRGATGLRAAVELALRGPPVTARLFAPGAHIVVEGERGDCAFVIARGTCVAYKTVDGERVVLNRLDAGSVFGETAVLSGGLRTATVEAETEVLVKIVSGQLLHQHVGHETPFGAVVLAQADRFRELDTERAARGRPDPEPSR